MMHIKKKNEGMNKGAIIAVVVVVVAGAGFLYKSLWGADGSKLYNDTPVVANIDGKPVYQAEVENVVKAVLANSEKQVSYKDLDENSKKMIVREIAAQRAMLKEASSKGVKEDKDTKRKLFELKNKVVIDAVIAKTVSPGVTQEKMLARYDEIEKAIKGKPQIRLSHILLSTEEDAKNALDRLKKDPFAKIAKELSQDSSTKDKGGDLGYLLAGTMDPDFEKAALSLKTGDVSAPVKTKFGWHIVKLEEKKLANVAPFEALKPRIAQDIYNETLKKYADSLLAKTKIELVEPDAGKKEKAEDAKKPEPKTEVKKEEVKQDEVKKDEGKKEATPEQKK